MSDVGYASLQIIPSAKGFASKLDSQIQGPLAASGGSAGEKAGGSFVKTFTKVAAGAALAGGAAVAAFATKSADTFARVGGEVTKLSRYTGLAAQDASRLRFAGEESGIGIDQMTKSLGFLSKAVSGKTLDKLGIQLKDTHGKALPLNTDLLTIAKRFQSMPDGIEKNALALKLFGKSGADLIPFLNKGADGIAELEKQSDKFGQTLSGSDLAAVKASTIAHREFSAAMDGLQIQVGRYVLPIITKLVTFTTSALIPAIHGAADIASKYLAPAFDFAFGIVSKVAGSALSFITGRLVPGVEAGFARMLRVVTPWAEGVRQAFDVVLKGDFTGKGPFAEDSPFIVALFKFRATVETVVRGALQTIRALFFGEFTNAPGPFAEDSPFIVGLFKFRDLVQTVVQGAEQTIRALFFGDFSSAPGPFAEDSPFIEAILKFRDLIVNTIIPDLKKLIDVLSGNLPAAFGTAGVGAIALATHYSGLAASIGGVIQAAAILPNPVLLVAAALAALAGGMIYAYTHSSRFRGVIDDIASTIKDKFTQALPYLKQLGTFIVSDVLPALGKFADFVIHTLAPGLADFAGRVAQVVQWIADHLVPVFKTLGGIIGDQIGYFKDLAEAVGKKALPILKDIGKWIVDHTPIVQAFAILIGTTLTGAFVVWGVQSTIAAAKAAAGFVLTAAKAAIALPGIIADLVSIGIYELAAGADALIMGGQMAAAWLLGLGPIGLIVAGVVAAAIIIYENWDTIKNAAGVAFDYISDHWRGILEILTGPIGIAVVFITDHWDTIKSAFSTVVGFIASVGSTMWDGLGTGLTAVIGVIKGGLQVVIDIVNTLIDGFNLLPGSHIPNIPNIDGSSHNPPKLAKSPLGAGLLATGQQISNPTNISNPTTTRVGPRSKITKFAEGGFVKHRPGGILANIGEGRHDEMVTPLSASALAPFAKAMAPMTQTSDRGPSIVNVYPSPGMDEEALAKAVVKQFARRAKSDGPFLTKIGAAR